MDRSAEMSESELLARNAPSFCGIFQCAEKVMPATAENNPKEGQPSREVPRGRNAVNRTSGPMPAKRFHSESLHLPNACSVSQNGTNFKNLT